MNPDTSRHRLGLLAITAISLFGALFARLWFLQGVEASTLEAKVTSNATRTVITPAPRGRILDRNGVVLVQNRESLVVAVDLQAYKRLDTDEQPKLLERLAATLSRGREPADAVTTKFLHDRLNDARFSPYRPIPVAEDITVDQEIYFREQAARFPAVLVEHQTVRDYPYKSLAAHVLGYVGALSEEEYAKHRADGGAKPYERSDEIGKSGVERSYEPFLRGTPGRRVYEVDRSNRVVREITSERVEPKQGDDVYLNLDLKVQYEAERALRGRLLAAQGGRNTAEAGGVVVLDPRDGSVRAMASYPTYDPSDLVGGIGQAQWSDLQGYEPGPDGTPVLDEDGDPVVAGPSKLLNRATAGGYPPASTFKLATAYAALKTGIITPQDTIADPGYYRFCDGDSGGCLKTNAGGAAHGSVNLQTALTVSSDVYFYRIGDIAWEGRSARGLSDDALQERIRDLGYGAKTGIDLPAEAPGLVPTPASEAEIAQALYDQNPAAYDNDPAKAEEAGRWRTGFEADLAIGQKVTATPLQTANAYASLANGGTLWTPHVVDRVTKANSPTVIQDIAPKAIRQIDWGDAQASLIAGFAGVVQPGGTAGSTFAGFPFASMPLAGKTGTAQTGEDAQGNEKPDNSLFVAWNLANPEWVASAMLEGAGAGAQAAAPAIRMILEPIASGEINSVEVPQRIEIDAESAADESADIGTTGSD